jgi:hypothetical protein
VRLTLLSLIAALGACTGTAGPGKSGGLEDDTGSGGSGGPGGDTDTDTALALSGEVVCAACSGDIIVALFDAEGSGAAPLADLVLAAPGPFRFEPGPGEYVVLGFGDDNGNHVPDPAEASGELAPLVLADASIDGLTLTLEAGAGGAVYANAPDCEAHALDTVVQAGPLIGESISVDGVADEWADLAPLVSDPPGDTDDCGEGGSGASDILALHLAEDDTHLGALLQLGADPDPDEIYVLSFRQLGDGWGAGDLWVEVGQWGEGAWSAQLVTGLLDDPQVVGDAEVAAGPGQLELRFGRNHLGDPRGYRVRAWSGEGDAGDETAFVHITDAAGGIADAAGFVRDPTTLHVLLAEGGTEADLASALVGLGDVTVHSWSDDMAGGIVLLDPGPLDTWAERVAAIDDADALLALLEADPAVEIAALAEEQGGSFAVVKANDLNAWVGHGEDFAMWSTWTPQITEAQQVVVDCYPRIELDRVHVAAVDAGVPAGESDAASASRRWAFGDFFEGEHIEHAFEAGQAAHQSYKPDHGWMVASVMAKKSTSTADGLGEPTSSYEAETDRFVVDRMSGVLSFGGEDPDFDFPVDFRYHNWGHAGHERTSRYVAAGSAARDGAEILNASWGAVRQHEYCKEDGWAWRGEGEGRGCEKDGQRDPLGLKCGKVSGGSWASFWGGVVAFRRLARAHPDTLFVHAAGNRCDDLTQMRWTASWLDDADYDNVLIVGGQSPGTASETDVQRSFWSNHGPTVDVYAPGDVVTWIPNVWHEYEPTGGPDGDPALRNYLTKRWRYKWTAGTSFSAPLVASVATMVKALQPALSPAELESLLEETSEPLEADIATSTLNAARAVTNATLRQLGEGGNALMSVHATRFDASCDLLAEGETMGDAMAVECASVALDGVAGGLTGAGVLNPADAESAHTLEGSFDPSAGTLAFTLSGTDWAPGPGPADTSFEGSLTALDGTAGTAAWRVEGEFEGSVEQLDSEGEVISRCVWSGDFAGMLWEGEVGVAQE